MSAVHDEADDIEIPGTPRPPNAYAHVIVPFDGTADAQRAALAGADVAAAMDAELVVATIGEGARRVDPALKARAVSLSDERATMWVEPGRSSVRALQTMLRYRPGSLVCMYTHARTGLLHAVYGSLADQLLHELDVPLLLLGPKCVEPVASTRHLVVCVDHSPAAGTAVRIATDWATTTAPNATVVYRYEQDEVVADVDDLIAPLVAACPIVEKAAVERRGYLDGVLDIVRHSTSSIVVTAWSPSGGPGRMRHDPFLAQLSLKSPVPILVQRAADGRR